VTTQKYKQTLGIKMAININNLSGKNVNTQQKLDNAKQQAQASSQTTAQNTKMSQDSLVLTAQAKSLEKIRKKSGMDNVDQKRIDELKKAITSGEYKVDAKKLMNNILAHEFDLFED
jgi:negative regulator of flagellin synthesis FlgM|tara:strand:+ start:1409 stop:1759 length:351 start_codon:yes stop_codon:yes gene_type:complete